MGSEQRVELPDETAIRSGTAHEHQPRNRGADVLPLDTCDLRVEAAKRRANVIEQIPNLDHGDLVSASEKDIDRPRTVPRRIDRVLSAPLPAAVCCDRDHELLPFEMLV